jgi:hypothetical protein
MEPNVVFLVYLAQQFVQGLLVGSPRTWLRDAYRTLRDELQSKAASLAFVAPVLGSDWLGSARTCLSHPGAEAFGAEPGSATVLWSQQVLHLSHSIEEPRY